MIQPLCLLEKTLNNSEQKYYKKKYLRKCQYIFHIGFFNGMFSYSKTMTLYCILQCNCCSNISGTALERIQKSLVAKYLCLKKDACRAFSVFIKDSFSSLSLFSEWLCAGYLYVKGIIQKYTIVLDT